MTVVFGKPGTGKFRVTSWFYVVKSMLMTRIEQEQLDNGLRIIVLPMAGIESLTVMGMVKAGSRYEKEERAGLAHFYEHMVFKGTQKYPSKKLLAEAADKVGAEYNGATGKEYTFYYVKSAAKDFTTSFDILSQLLLEPLLAKEEIEVERGVIREELNMYHDTPQYRSDLELQHLLFPNHRLGGVGVGNEETIARLDEEDFRQLRQRFYTPDKMVIVLAGRVKDEMIAAVKQEFSALEPADEIDFSPFQVSETDQGVKLVRKEAGQVHLALGVRGFSYNQPRHWSQRLLSTILGSGMSSRLFQSVREERGLCYSIQTATEFYDDTSVFKIQAGLNKDKIAEAIATIKEELDKIMAEPVAEEELEKAKNFLRGKTILSLEDSSKRAAFYAKRLLLQADSRSFDELIKELNKVDESDILSTAKELLPPQDRHWAVVTDKEIKKDLI